MPLYFFIFINNKGWENFLNRVKLICDTISLRIYNT